MVVVAGVAVAGTGWLRAADGCGHVHIHDELWRLFNVLRARLRSLAGAIKQLFMLFLLSNVASPGQGVAMADATWMAASNTKVAGFQSMRPHTDSSTHRG